MNLSDFRTRVARVVGLSTSNAQDLALIDSFVNESVVQFLRDTKINVVKASLSVTAGQPDYTLDTDIIAFTDAWYEPSGGNQKWLLEPVSSRDILAMRIAEGAVESATRYIAIQGAHLIMLHPAPQSSEDKLHILYVPRPTAVLSATSHSPADPTRGNIPEEFHPILEAYVKWKTAEAEEHRPSDSGRAFQAEYEAGVMKTRAILNKKAGVFLPRKRHGRRRPFPFHPGVDLR